VSRVTGKCILVTGGAGFIGSHVVDRLLLERPERVVVVDSFFLGQDENLKDAQDISSSLDVLRLDAGDFSSIFEVVREFQVDMVLNLAVMPLPLSLRFPALTLKTNVDTVIALCELVRIGAIRELLHVSSSEVYGTARYVPMNEAHPHDVTTPYAASKSAGDQIVSSYVRTFGISARTVRPFNNFGPRQNLGSYAGVIPIVVNRLARNLPIEITGDGTQTRDFVFVKETARGIVDVLNSEKCQGMTLNIATGVETSINELVSQIANVMGKGNPRIQFVPSRDGDVLRHCADTSLAKQILGYSAEPISLSQLDETVSWYLSSLRL